MTAYRIPRHDNVDLVLQDGELLADLSSRENDEQQRWTEVRVYRARAGRYVTEMVGRSTNRGEHDRRNVNVYDNPADVRLGFLRPRTGQPGVTYLTALAEEAIEIAARKYPELSAALEEHV